VVVGLAPSQGPRRALLAGLIATVLAVTGCSSPAATAWQQGHPVPATGEAKPPTAPTSITILGSGDVLLHPPLWDQARADAKAEGKSGYDFGPLFSGVRDLVSSADLAVCHMETPLAPPDGPFIGFPRFSVPPQVATTLADVGYDTCSTASNHTLDEGEAGIDRTLDDLDAAGIHHAGSYRSSADHDTVNMLDVAGVKVAHLSYTFGFNGLTRPKGKEWLANLTDKDAILAEAHRAKTEGAEIVIVSLHWGTEYQHGPNANQLTLAKQLLASGDVDLILGCHAHVVQPFEKINGKWVVYGMGNEVAHHSDPIDDNREGVIARFTFTQTGTGGWTVTKAEAIPVWMDFGPNRLVDLAAMLADTSTSSARRSVYQHAYDQIKGFLDSRGADRDGLTLTG
jgi:poly-gamma-glutamate synthesis protein (capsule biosynthesis protein)